MQIRLKTVAGGSNKLKAKKYGEDPYSEDNTIASRSTVLLHPIVLLELAWSRGRPASAAAALPRNTPPLAAWDGAQFMVLEKYKVYFKLQKLKKKKICIFSEIRVIYTDIFICISTLSIRLGLKKMMSKKNFSKLLFKTLTQTEPGIYDN